MNSNESQVPIQEFSLDGIGYILFQPFSERYYEYHINSVNENGHLIEKQDVNKFFVKGHIGLIPQVGFFLDRFKSFIFLIETSKVIEVIANQGNVLAEIEKNLVKEMIKPKEENEESELKSKWKQLYQNSDSRVKEMFSKLQKGFWKS